MVLISLAGGLAEEEFGYDGAPSRQDYGEVALAEGSLPVAFVTNKMRRRFRERAQDLVSRFHFEIDWLAVELARARHLDAHALATLCHRTPGTPLSKFRHLYGHPSDARPDAPTGRVLGIQRVSVMGAFG
jgi:hypothetical protein